MIQQLAAGEHRAWLLVLVIVAALLLAGYAVACAIWPFTSCWRCHGTGKRRSPTNKRFRLCRGCGGTARRRRFGRWAYDRVRGNG